MNRVFLDTNVFVDLLIDENSVDDKNRLRNDIEKVKRSKKIVYDYIKDGVILVINTTTLVNAFFLLTQKAKVSSEIVANKFLTIENSTNFFFVVEESKDIRVKSLRYSIENSFDYEDALQYFCALDSQCKAIITNDKEFIRQDIALIRTNPNLKNYYPKL